MSRWGKSEQGSPTDEPRGTPRDLHPTSDIRFAITEIAKYGERIDNLAEKIAEMKADVAGADGRLDQIEKGISFVKGAVWVFGGLFAITLVGFGVVLTVILN